ncbi:hypothetical protein TRIP_B120016 [uncultured Desulfatiglans sp.]|uniref:Uncharacterized protein n=1 Tax=Uncultured Desulfatiglans sp. TaxID=1748965 RepID=A0A653A0M1_UNCDX|nr:hypothetical protein TRIP_B120016 [uncultured Desulfatiglans sp.]
MTTKKELLTRIRLNCQECVGGPRACERQMGHKAEPGFRVGSQRVAENGIKSERLDAGPKNACYYASE